jgi:hypothetical protein
LDISPKKLVPRMLSHRENVRTWKFWRNFFSNFTKGIKGFDLGHKKSKLFHACVPLSPFTIFLQFSEGEEETVEILSSPVPGLDIRLVKKLMPSIINSVPDPDSPDPHVFGPSGSGSGSTSQRYGSGSFYHHAKIVRKTLIPTVLRLFLTFY